MAKNNNISKFLVGLIFISTAQIHAEWISYAVEALIVGGVSVGSTYWYEKQKQAKINMQAYEKVLNSAAKNRLKYKDELAVAQKHQDLLGQKGFEELQAQLKDSYTTLADDIKEFEENRNRLIAKMFEAKDNNKLEIVEHTEQLLKETDTDLENLKKIQRAICQRSAYLALINFKKKLPDLTREIELAQAEKVDDFLSTAPNNLSSGQTPFKFIEATQKIAQILDKQKKYCRDHELSGHWENAPGLYDKARQECKAMIAHLEWMNHALQNSKQFKNEQMLKVDVDLKIQHEEVEQQKINIKKRKISALEEKNQELKRQNDLQELDWQTKIKTILDDERIIKQKIAEINDLREKQRKNEQTIDLLNKAKTEDKKRFEQQKNRQAELESTYKKELAKLKTLLEEVKQKIDQLPVNPEANPDLAEFQRNLKKHLQQLEENKQTTEEIKCVICQENIQQHESSFCAHCKQQNGTMVQQHIFHTECIQNFKNSSADKELACPLCRGTIENLN